MGMMVDTVSDSKRSHAAPKMGLEAEIARREAEVAALRTQALAAAQADLAARERELRALRDEVRCAVCPLRNHEIYL